MLTKGGPLFLCSPVYSSDCKLLLVPCSRGIKIYSVDTGLLIRCLSEHSGQVTCLRLSDDKLYSSSDSGEIIVFKGEALEVCEQMQVDFSIHQLVPTSEGLLLVSRVDEGRDSRSCLYIWHQGRAVLLKEFVGKLFIDYQNGILFCANHTSVSINRVDGESLITLNTMSVSRSVTCLQSNDEVLAVGDASGRITIWRLNSKASNMTTQTLHWHSHSVRSLRLLSSGYLLSGGRESVLVLWRMSDQNKQFLPKIGESLEQIVVRPDERQFAVCSKSNRIYLIDAASFRCSLTIDGLSWMTGRANLVDRMTLLDGDNDTILVRGAAGTLQAFDARRDRSVFVLPIVELLLTDPSTSSHDSNPNSPMIYHFTNDDQWIVSAEGRPGVDPHFGYIKMFERKASFTDYQQHTIIHQPHQGPVNDICMSTVGNDRVVCSVSEADTFKLLRLEHVYDSALLKKRPAWRVLYADPLNVHPSACSLHSSGRLLVSVGKRIIVLDIVPLLDGSNVRPSFIKTIVAPIKAAAKKNIKRLQWINSDQFIACTDHDIFKLNVNGPECLHWAVRNYEMSVALDRMAVLTSNSSQHWLLELELDGLKVIKRHPLDTFGRAVLCYKDTTLCALNDGRMLVFGRDQDIVEPELNHSVKKPRFVEPFKQPDPVVSEHHRKASIVKSRKHLFPLLTTAQLPSMRDIFASFIIPRIIK